MAHQHHAASPSSQQHRRGLAPGRFRSEERGKNVLSSRTPRFASSSTGISSAKPPPIHPPGSTTQFSGPSYPPKGLSRYSPYPIFDFRPRAENKASPRKPKERADAIIFETRALSQDGPTGIPSSSNAFTRDAEPYHHACVESSPSRMDPSAQNRLTKVHCRTHSHTASPRLHAGSPPSEPFPACEIVVVQGLGRGLRSTRPLTRGETILREKPFIRFSHPITRSSILSCILSISTSRRLLFLSFTGTVPGVEDEWVSIAETNAIPLGEQGGGDAGTDSNSKEDYPRGPEDRGNVEGEDAIQKEQDVGCVRERSFSGMFETICRVNHSCAPNAGWRWDDSAQELLLFALTDIDSSTDITASYLDPTELVLPRSSRQSLLSDNFGFVCQCDACDKSTRKIAESDKRLAQYRTIKATWESTAIEDYAFDQKRALAEIEQAMELLYLENKYREVEHVLEQRFRVYAAYGKREAAKGEARKVTKHYRLVAGRLAARESDAAKLSDRPEPSIAWEACLKVEGLLTDLSDSDFEGSDGEDPWEDLDFPGIGSSRRHRGSGLKRR